MALKPIGIEDNNTFPGRVGQAITQYAKDANTDKAPKARTPFVIRHTGTAWEYTSLAAAQAAGLDPVQMIWFIGNAGGSIPSWARANDMWTQG